MLTYLGLSVGNFLDYVRVPSGSPERDSVEAVYPLPVYGACTDLSGKLVKVRILRDTTVDSTFIWAGDEYYHNPLHRFAKYNISLGDSWGAWNDCILPLNTPVPVPDVDRDSIADTIIYRPSTAVVESTDAVVEGIGGNVKVVLVLNSKLITTSSMSPDSTLMTEYRTYYYVPDFGITKVMWDSTAMTVFFGSFSNTGTMPVGVGKVIRALSVEEDGLTELEVPAGPFYDVSGRRTTRKGRLRKGRIVIF